MSEKRLLSQTRVVCLLCLFLVGAALRGQEASSGFNCEIFLGSATTRTLCLGVAASKDDVLFTPYPPENPAGDVYLLGRYDESDAESDSLVGNYFTLSDDVRFLDGAQAATWTLVAQKDTEITFKLAAGKLPQGALKLAGQDIELGKSVKVEGGMTYAITYQASPEVQPAPEQPENIEADMVRVGGISITADVSPKAALVGTVTAHDVDGTKVAEAFGQAQIVEGVLTYTLPESIDPQVATVRLSYVNRTEAGDSVPATILITLTDDIAFRCLSSKSVTLEAGKAEEGKNTTMAKFEIVVPHGYETPNMPLTLVLHAWMSPGVKPFPYTASVKLYTDKTFETPDPDSALDVTANAYETSFELPVTGGKTLYLGVTLTAADKAESIRVYLDATLGDELVRTKGPYIHIKGTGTLDFDGDNDIDDNDAIMFYNFTSLGGVELPEDFAGDGYKALSEGLDVTSEGAQNARDLFIQNPQFLDFDGNNDIDDNDAIMFYNFTSLGGVELPDDFAGDGYKVLSEGLNVTPEGAKRARDFFINTSQQ